MARFIFNQEVKHEASNYSEGDVVTISDELADYFASNSWGYIEGQDSYDGEPIINPNIEPVASKDILLDVHSSVIGLEDTNG